MGEVSGSGSGRGRPGTIEYYHARTLLLCYDMIISPDSPVAPRRARQSRMFFPPLVQVRLCHDSNFFSSVEGDRPPLLTVNRYRYSISFSRSFSFLGWPLIFALSN